MNRYTTINIRGKNWNFDRYTLTVADAPFASSAPVVAPPKYVPQKPNPKITTCVIEPTHGCNLACDYCFHGSKNASGRLDIEVAKKFLLEKCRLATRKKTLSIVFMGGEASTHMDCIFEIVEWVKANKYKARFSTTTNGTRMLVPFKDGTIADYLMANKFGIHLSLDGPPEVQDKHRKYASGRGSSADIMRGLEYLKSKAYRAPSVRATFGDDVLDAGGVSFLQRLQYLNSLVDQKMTRSVALEHVSLTEDAFYHTTVKTASDHQDRKRLEAGYREQLYASADWFIAEVQAGRYPKWSGLEKAIRPLIYHRPRVQNGCGAGKGYITLGCDGKVHACHRQQGLSMSECVGGPLSDSAKLWIDEEHKSRNICAECFIQYACGGGCKAASLAAGLPITEPVPRECMIRTIIFEAAIIVVTTLGEDLLRRIYKRKSNSKAQRKSAPYKTKAEFGPTLVDMLLNFARASVSHAKAGFKSVTEREFRRRLSICRRCKGADGLPNYDPTGWWGRGRCRECGCCSHVKLHWAEQKCPMKPPRWGAWTPDAGLESPAHKRG